MWTDRPQIRVGEYSLQSERAREKAEMLRAICVILFVATALSLQAVGSAEPSDCTKQVRVADAQKLFNNDFGEPCEAEVVKGCKLGVVGAGYGGAYFAYRLAIDEKRVEPSEVCVFEASTHRIGGRVYTVRNLLGDPELVVDVGGYRYVPSQKLTALLIERRLGLSTRCYLPVTCEDARRIVVDDTELNAIGYAAPIEKMLQELVDGGARVFSGYKLTGVYNSLNKTATGAQPLKLQFENGANAIVEQLMLNIPNEAIARLDGRSVLFNQQSRLAQGGYMTPDTLSSTKVYLEYPDAWWITKLGKLEGRFETLLDPKLKGRYHDGAARCFDAQGNQIPITSGSRIARCNGLLLAAYFGASDSAREKFYVGFQKLQERQEPLTIVKWDESDTDFELIQKVHKEVMNFHKKDLEAKGVDVSKIQPPSFLYMGNWRAENELTGAIHEWPFFLPGSSVAQTTKALLRPVPGYDIFLANEAFGVSPGWADGSVMMAERVLAHELGVGKPEWLFDEKYYNETVLDLTFFDLLTVQLFDHKHPKNAPFLA